MFLLRSCEIVVLTGSSSDHFGWHEERLMELDLDPSCQELSHRYELNPGSLWQARF